MDSHSCYFLLNIGEAQNYLRLQNWTEWKYKIFTSYHCSHSYTVQKTKRIAGISTTASPSKHSLLDVSYTYIDEL